MKTVFGALFFLSCSIIFISCQKDLEGTVERPVPGNNGNFYIDTVYEYWVENGMQVLANTDVYSYDALKRVSEIKRHSAAEGPVYNGTAIFTYNGADTLPVSKKLTGYASLQGTNEEFFDTTVNYYFYNPAGDLIKDSMIISENNTIGIWGPDGYLKRLSLSKFEYQSNNSFFHYSIDTALVDRGANWSVDYTADSVSLDAAGNILRSVHYQGVPWPNLFHSFTETFTYDNRLNPFKSLNIYKTLNKLSHEFSGAEGFQSTNNVIQTVNESTGRIINYPVINTYRADGLLEKVIIPYDYYPLYDDRDWIVFTYKKL